VTTWGVSQKGQGVALLQDGGGFLVIGTRPQTMHGLQYGIIIVSFFQGSLSGGTGLCQEGYQGKYKHALHIRLG
jgi:hypothetical protein